VIKGLDSVPADLLDAIAKSNPQTLQGFRASGFWSRGFGPVIRASVMNNTPSFLGFGPRVSACRVSLGSGVPDVVPADLFDAIAKSNPHSLNPKLTQICMWRYMYINVFIYVFTYIFIHNVHRYANVHTQISKHMATMSGGALPS